MIIRRKVKLELHQGWSDAILPYLNEKPYYKYRIAEYEEGLWESEDLMNAYVGATYTGESPIYVYKHKIMSKKEYDEWTTMSG